MIEACDKLFRIQLELLESFVEVEQVAVLPSLQECAQFGSEEFLRLEGGDFRFDLISVVDDLERIFLNAKQAPVLACVDFDLQFQYRVRSNFWRKPENQVHRVACLFPIALLQPPQRLAARA